MFNPDPDTQQPGTGHGGHVAMADPGELRLGIAAKPSQLDITQDRGESFRLWKGRWDAFFYYPVSKTTHPERSKPPSSHA